MAQDKFHCIILKGGDQYPYFPRPLLSEFDFDIPISSKPKPSADDELLTADNDDKKLEREFVLRSLLTAQKSDLVKSTNSSYAERLELANMQTEIDKTLLRMMMAECIEGEERGMRALELVGLMGDRSGRMIEAAGKVAEKYERGVLGEKIRALGEQRLGEMEEED